MSATAGPRSRTHIMLKMMWSRLPCSQPALSTVHHRPYPKTGMPPLAPSRNSTPESGARKPKRPPPMRIALPESSSEMM